MIRKWHQFISESQLELFNNDIYPFTEDDLSDYLLEFEEAGYRINLQFGWKDDDVDGNHFTRKIKSYINEPSILVRISGGKSSDDMTKSLKTFINRMSRKAKLVEVYDDDGKLDLKNIKIQGGIFLNEKPEDSEPDENGAYHDIQLDCIEILCVFNKRKLTNKEILEYYSIKGEKIKTNDGEIDCLSYDESGLPIFEVEIDDLAKWAINRNDSYVNFILNPDSIWDWYLGSFAYTPDHYSFLYYHLDRENLELLLRVCIQEDGWDEIKQNLKDENITQEEFIKLSVKNTKEYRELGELIEELPNSSDIYNDLRGTYVDFEEQAKAMEDLEEIIEKFDEIIEEEFKTTIVGKNKYYQKVEKIKDGKSMSYDQEIQTYKIKFNFEWFEDMDANTIFNAGSTYNILLEYTSNVYSQEIKPYFKDYASVDDKEFNKEIKSILKRIYKSES